MKTGWWGDETEFRKKNKTEFVGPYEVKPEQNENLQRIEMSLAS